MLWKNLKIGKKLFIGFGVMILLLIIASSVGYRGIQTVWKSLIIVGDEEAPVVDMANEMKIALMVARNAMEEYKAATAALATDDEASLQEIEEFYQKSLSDFDTFTTAVLEGKTLEDGTVVIPTDNEALSALIVQADQIHDQKFQPSAEEMMQAGKDLLVKIAETDVAMVKMEAAFDEISSDALNVEKKIDGEIQLRADAAQIDDEARAILREEIPLLDLANEMKFVIAETRLVLEEFVQTKSLEEFDILNLEYQEKIKEFDTLVNAVLHGAEIDGVQIFATDNDDVRAMVLELDENHQTFQNEAALLMTSYQSAVLQSSHAENSMAQLDAFGNEASELLNQVERLAGDEMVAARKSGAEASSNATFWLITVALCSIGLGIGIGIVITRGITKPMDQCLQLANAVSEGDLTRVIDLNQKDEIGLVANSLNKMSENLRDLINEIQSSSSILASSSEEMSASSQNLASGAAEQAANLEETSAALAQFTVSIEQIVDNALETSGVSSRVVIDAENGGEAVIDTVDNMKKIASHITIVNDIADQTNLLALNAAIEAARAGELGKGFAVVAVEIRKLAERSQYAAKEISDLAISSVNKAEDAGNLIQTVVPNVRGASESIQIIHSTCQEQAGSAKQIRMSVDQLNLVTQQNSAISEECASSSEELAAQAQTLQSLISHFRIDRASNHAPVQAKMIANSNKQKQYSESSEFGKNDKHDKSPEFVEM